jgi:hypothetical protein
MAQFSRLRFKEEFRQTIYDICRSLGNIPTSEFYCDGWPDDSGVYRAAYWKGRRGEKLYNVSRKSLIYVCWAAGQDDFRHDLVTRRPNVTWKRKLLYPRDERKISDVYAFTNGMTIAFDQYGKQMLRGRTNSVMPRIRAFGYNKPVATFEWKRSNG